MDLKKISKNLNDLSEEVIDKVSKESKELDSRSMINHYDKSITKFLAKRDNSKRF